MGNLAVDCLTWSWWSLKGPWILILSCTYHLLCTIWIKFNIHAVHLIDWHFPEVRKSIDLNENKHDTSSICVVCSWKSRVLVTVNSVMSQQDNWPTWLSNDLNKIESKVVWQISFKACQVICKLSHLWNKVAPGIFRQHNAQTSKAAH